MLVLIPEVFMQKIVFYLFSGGEMRFLRSRMKLTRDAMAQNLNISRAQLIALESNRKEITPELSRNFVEVLKREFKYPKKLSLVTGQFTALFKSF